MIPLLFATALHAAPLSTVPACQGLGPEALARAEQLASTEYLWDCCDDTIATCLTEPTPCKLAFHAADEICQRVAAGEADSAIHRALELRGRSMTGTPFDFDLTGWPVLGDPDAPVLMVSFVCLRCPFCARLEPQLVDAVTNGALKGKARLVVKLFPLKSHPGSTQAALAALAADGQGAYYRYMRATFEGFSEFDAEHLDDTAVALGLDKAAFDQAYSDDAVRARLVASKREGIAAGVDATPAIYIDGRRYQARLEISQIQALVEEAYERSTGQVR